MRQRVLAGIALLLIGSWALLSSILQPLWERLRDLKGQVAAQTERLDATARWLARDAPQPPMAPVSDVSALLVSLETLARQANVPLGLKPNPRSQDPHSQVDVELQTEGSQAQLLTFLDALFALPHLVTVERLQLASVSTSDPLLRLTLLLRSAPSR